MLVDDTLHVFGFNYTKLDIEKSRSFGIVTTRQAAWSRRRCALFEADAPRQAYSPTHDRARRQPGDLARRCSTAFIKGARKAAAHLRRAGQRQPDAAACSPSAPQRASRSASSASSRRTIAAVEVPQAAGPCGCTSARSSATARAAFIGSQSLRKLELDGRREVGVIVTDARDRAQDAGGLRGRLGADARGDRGRRSAEKDKEKDSENQKDDSYFRRVITPESITLPGARNRVERTSRRRRSPPPGTPDPCRCPRRSAPSPCRCSPSRSCPPDPITK